MDISSWTGCVSATYYVKIPQYLVHFDSAKSQESLSAFAQNGCQFLLKSYVTQVEYKLQWLFWKGLQLLNPVFSFLLLAASAVFGQKSAKYH